MLKLFRNIRKRLLSDNKFIKYLFYAVGEIFLVVIGILIALWINSSYQNNQERKTERTYLTSMIVDLDHDIETFSNSIRTSEEIIATFSKSLKWFNNNKPQPDSSTLQLMLAMSITILFESQDLTFQEMKSSGKFDLITSDNIKNSIISYYDEVQRVKEKSMFNKQYSADMRNWEFMGAVWDMNSMFSQLYPEITEVDPFKSFPFHDKEHPLRELLIETTSSLMHLEILEKKRIIKILKKSEVLKEQIQYKLK